MTLGQCLFGNGSNVASKILAQRRLTDVGRTWANVCKATLGQYLWCYVGPVSKKTLAQRRLTDIGPTSLWWRWPNVRDVTLDPFPKMHWPNVALQTLGQCRLKPRWTNVCKITLDQFPKIHWPNVRVRQCTLGQCKENTLGQCFPQRIRFCGWLTQNLILHFTVNASKSTVAGAHDRRPPTAVCRRSGCQAGIVASA